MASILEAIMVICFGISWPLNIVKSIKTKTAKGKSIWFLSFILLGYIAGVAGKIISAVTGGTLVVYVFVFYCLNLVMVTTDYVLTLKNMKRDKQSSNK